MDQAIKKAIKGGYEFDFKFYLSLPDYAKSHIWLDPEFWQALGRAMGWAEEKFYSYDGIHHTGENMPEAKFVSRCFWNHVWDGGSTDDFFNQLIK